MANTGSTLIGRLAAVMFFIAAGAGLYALITHDNLQTARAQLTSVIQERDQLKSELVGTEKTVLTSSSELQMCTRELKTIKGHTTTQTQAGPDAKFPDAKSGKAL